MAAIARTSWIGVTAMDWPMAVVAISDARMSSGSKRIPASSPGRPMPVGSPKPNAFAYFMRFSAPRRKPTCAKPVFSDCFTTSVNVTVPKLAPFQFWIRRPETMT